MKQAVAGIDAGTPDPPDGRIERADDGTPSGTLHEGAPFVSMVPVAWRPDGAALIHVSALAPHTRDLRLHPAVSLMLLAPRVPGDDPQALARVTLQAEAVELAAGSAAADAAAAVYRARFPRAEQTFGLAATPLAEGAAATVDWWRTR